MRVGHGCTIVVHSRNELSFPGLVFLKVDWAAFRVWYWVMWQEPRCWSSLEEFGVGRLLADIVELVYTGYPLSVIRGLVHSLPCSRVAQICRKTVLTWISLRKNRMVDDDVFHLHDVHLSSVRSVCVHSCACVDRADSALPSIGS